MNATHLKMARHMLGLPNRARRSYTENEGRHIFGRLTRKGADMALERGEALCAEDFP